LFSALESAVVDAAKLGKGNLLQPHLDPSTPNTIRFGLHNEDADKWASWTVKGAPPEIARVKAAAEAVAAHFKGTKEDILVLDK
jgi:hypothetical protein